MMIKPVKIGNIQTENNLFLAPLAGFTDFAFRGICGEFGAGLTVTEMVSAKGLIYGNKVTQGLYKFTQAKNFLPFNYSVKTLRLFVGRVKVKNFRHSK